MEINALRPAPGKSIHTGKIQNKVIIGAIRLILGMVVEFMTKSSTQHTFDHFLLDHVMSFMDFHFCLPILWTCHHFL